MHYTLCIEIVNIYYDWRDQELIIYNLLLINIIKSYIDGQA